MKKITLLLLVMFSLSTTFAQETVTNRNGKEITVNKEASTTEKGIVKLAGDLGGTADVPTVPALTNKVEGNGTVNYISKFSAAKTLVNSSLFDNGTNVGLGTISPVSKFEISDPSETFTSNGTLRISNSSDPTVNNFAGLVFKSNNVSGVGGSWKIGSNQESTTSYNQNFHFLNSSNGSAYASKMTLTPAGYMGIGTTNPVAELSNTSTSIIGSNGQSSSSSTGFAWANTNLGWAGAFWSDYQGLNVKVKNTSSIAFEVGSGIASQNDNAGGGGSTPLFKVLTNGNVGIGVSSPIGKLNVNDATYIAAMPSSSTDLMNNTTFRPHSRFQVTSGVNNNALSNYFTTTAVAQQAHNYSIGTALPFILQPAGGNVGIGATAPANKLEITHGTAGNSGLRFTNLNSASTAPTTSSKVLGLNSTGDVILTNVPGTQNIIAFSTATPTTSGVVFTPDTQNDQSVVYQSASDNSMWTYNGSSYVTYTPPASTAWYTSGTTNDAGNSKTSNIYRTGSVGIGIAAPLNKLVVKGTNNSVSALGTAQTNATFRIDGDTNHSLDMGTFSAVPYGAYIQSHNKTSTVPLPLFLNPVGGNVGIGTTTPAAKLDVSSGVTEVARFTTSLATTNYAGIAIGNETGAWGKIASGEGKLQIRNFTTDATVFHADLTTGNIGIGNTAPASKLHVTFDSGTTSPIFERKFSSSVSSASLKFLLNTTTTAIATQPAGDFGQGLHFAYKSDTETEKSVGAITSKITDYANNKGELLFIVNNNTTGDSSMIIKDSGNVGIGTTAPGSKLEVNGASTNSVAYNAGSGTSIDFTKSNMAYTGASANVSGGFTLTGMKDGGTYTLAVKGAISGTATFAGSNPAGTAFTFKPANNGPTTAGKHTLYTFLVMGTDVYYYMVTGL